MIQENEIEPKFELAIVGGVAGHSRVMAGRTAQEISPMEISELAGSRDTYVIQVGSEDFKRTRFAQIGSGVVWELKFAATGLQDETVELSPSQRVPLKSGTFALVQELKPGRDIVRGSARLGVSEGGEEIVAVFPDWKLKEIVSQGTESVSLYGCADPEIEIIPLQSIYVGA